MVRLAYIRIGSDKSQKNIFSQSGVNIIAYYYTITGWSLQAMQFISFLLYKHTTHDFLLTLISMGGGAQKTHSF